MSEMERSFMLRLLAVFVAVGAFIVGATYTAAIELGLAIGVAVFTSVCWFLMPPGDENPSKLIDHMALSVPIAIMVIISGQLSLLGGVSGDVPDFGGIALLMVMLFVPASVLESRFEAETEKPAKGKKPSKKVRRTKG